MSLFGSLMGDLDDDIFGHMNAMNMQMRSMNRLMNSMMPDPFNMLTHYDPGFQQNALMERQAGPPAMGGLFGFPAMPNMNRLLSADIGANNGASFCSSSVITMSSGPDGRPQIYQASSSTKTGPNGVRETRRTVQDSMNGVKKMAIGHHIGERAHIIEKEQDLRSGQLEERQEFINLEEDDAEDFDREFTTKVSGAHGGPRQITAGPRQTLTIEPLDDDDDDDVVETGHSMAGGRPSSSGHNRRNLPALPAPPSPSLLQQPTQSSNSSSSAGASVTTTTAANMSPSSASSASTTHTAPYNQTTITTTTTPRRSTTAAAGGYHHHYHRSNHTGIAARRPLRTPPSSPLATTPTIHSHSTTATPSVHPHPYNSSAARRNHHHHHHHHHRNKHAKKHVSNGTAAPKPNSNDDGADSK